MIIRVKERIKYNVHNFADDDDQAKNAIVNKSRDARSKMMKLQSNTFFF